MLRRFVLDQRAERSQIIWGSGILALLFLAFSSCGKTEPATAASKDLFSSWARQSPAGFILDLTNMGFGSSSLRLFISSPTTGQCDCIVAIAGIQSSGQLVLSACSFVTGTGTDPGCASLSGAGTYTKTSDTLNLCRTGGSCADYK